MNKLIKLAVADFKIIFRNPSLRWFLLLPIVLYALILWGVPVLVEQYPFLIPYIPLFLVVAVVENTQTFSFLDTMVLIDEKEMDVAQVYGVAPLPKWLFITSRFVFPYAFTVALNLILLLLQPFFSIGLISCVVISALAGLIVPVYALGINSIAENRMQGMIYIKAINMVVLLPIAAFFLPENFKYLFGILPTHWLFQSIDAATHGTSITFCCAIGFLFFSGMLWWTSKAFIRKHFM